MLIITGGLFIIQSYSSFYIYFTNHYIFSCFDLENKTKNTTKHSKATKKCQSSSFTETLPLQGFSTHQYYFSWKNHRSCVLLPTQLSLSKFQQFPSGKIFVQKSLPHQFTTALLIFSTFSFLHLLRHGHGIASIEGGFHGRDSHQGYGSTRCNDSKLRVAAVAAW